MAKPYKAMVWVGAGVSARGWGDLYSVQRLARVHKGFDDRTIDMPPLTIPWRGAPYNDGQAELAKQALNPKPQTLNPKP